MLEIIAHRMLEELDRFFTLSQDLFCIAGFDGYFKSLNPSWEKTLGLTNPELLARPYIEFIHPEDRERTLAEARKLTTGRLTISFENRYQCKDGSYRWLHWKATPLQEARMIYAVARDVTEHRRLMQELSWSNEQVNLFLETLPIVTFRCAPEEPFGVSALSGNVEGLTGFPARAFTKESGLWRRRFHPEDEGAVFEGFLEKLDGGSRSIQFRWRLENESYAPFRAMLRLVRLPGGEPYRVLGAWVPAGGDS